VMQRTTLPSCAVTLLLALAAPSWAETDEPAQLLRSTSAEDAERAAALYEAQVETAPQSFEARLGAARALNQQMAIRSNGNLPLFDGLQDSDANRALWAKHAPRALEHARKALELQPRSVEAAAILATSFMFQASSQGILRSIVSGTGSEYRVNAQRVVDLDPKYDDALGDTLLASFYMVAPWPVGDSEASRVHYEHAAKLAPTSARVQYGQGVYWARNDDAKRARKHFERVVQMPCTANSEHLLCDFMKRESRRALSKLAAE
jgi:TRAP transporter TatT component family protein